ncbi:3-hydroxyacyl-[acyl-carrier-protein] dehydratase FabZ [Candidatus Woesearchaeota archaeon]|nr:3-hydroxyacyl-[acyl-carrier-protein] dehydratase FabZ [Candidatus Woesearchaeota archaeon]
MATIDELKNSKGEIDAAGIMQIIPYNEHFLMIDRVISVDKDKIVAEKFADPQADFFKGHFAGFPIMPGALIVEGMGQAGTLLVRYTIEGHEKKDVLAYKISEAKFSAPTFPGDTLRYEIKLLGKDDRGALLAATATVKGKPVAEARMMLAVVEKESFRAKSLLGR